MPNKNVTLDLKARKDKDGMIFYVAKIKAPVLIDCSKGAVFLVFISDQGDEQLQIALMDAKEVDD
jgi:hypothetical protein